MKLKTRLIVFVALLFSISCNQISDDTKLKNIVPDKTKDLSFVANEKFLTKHSDNCGCLVQLELKDSLKLVHIKGQFYKSATGHLYERTVGQQEVDGHLADHEYFNGYFSQEVDPLSFEPLDGWYAKDKKYVYYYRPLSGGMQILKIDTADIKTFKVLAGHYKYAVDERFFYDDSEIINGFVPSKTKLKFDGKGRAVKMTFNSKVYEFEIVE
ncbi:DKNYY domain-containing protein [Hymenobacter guriensis]|uniref:DKNYY domain-containing protein n=1 Tax=Hymenobacter guriensis TaxID=2793065 RepID=A0ABS0KX08_9BACT|nr:DKNYY domain-containing protein [Hymenobacter guriensis]MBG8552380.1 DKNYY domain-containing protein [Hymenobacter guriensis]